ncbi:unnamed protein product [Blepharisma stoltei]|uniref:Uncharacterized protein n=1 Tax=Blepharisma stoltei TaxID=1481888 RepID=A0AAU9JZB2_9CILI|nr:unnamed protein product [Blepharisma stoltei]
MDIPKILEHINDLHQNASERNEFIHFTEDLRTLLSESSKKSLLTCSTPEITTNSMIAKLNNLLPKTAQHQEISLFNLLAKHANSAKLSLNIPTTLIRIEHLPELYMIQTKREKIVLAKECTLAEFLSMTTAKNDSNFPTFCYKIPGKEVVATFSAESAERLWNSSEDHAILQYFIQSKTNPATITRVLWRRGMKNKYFTITNRKKVSRKLKKSVTIAAGLAFRRNKLMNNLEDYKNAGMMNSVSQSAGCPFRPGPKTPLSRKFLTMTEKSHSGRDESNFVRSFSTAVSKYIKDYDGYDPTASTDTSSQEDHNKEFIVFTKDVDSCYAIENYSRIAEIELMVDQIVEFLNLEVLKHHGLKGVVLDFVKDKHNNWFLLDCKEHFVDYMIPIDFEKSKRKTVIEKCRTPEQLERSASCVHSSESELRRQDSLLNEGYLHEIKEEDTQLSCPFKIRTKPKKIEHDPVSEKDLMERLNKVNAKIDRLNAQKSPARLSPINREESIQDYLNSYNYLKCPMREPTSASPISPRLVQSKSTTHLDRLIHDDKRLLYSRKVFKDVVDNFDEMALNVKIAKIKEQNIIDKYGGIDFWNKFIVSLYNKVLASDILNKHFKNSKLESFEMIVAGMFKILNAKVNLDFRRKIRAAHMTKGILEKEFYCYCDLFDSTLCEFNLEEDDRQGISSQIRNMKNIICRQVQQ